MSRFKICGIARPEDVSVAIAAGADAVGFVLVPSSPRFVPSDALPALMARVAPLVTAVAVVDLTDPLDQTGAKALERAVDLGVRCVQFHGHEASWEIARYKAGLHVQVIKAIRLQSDADLALMAPYEPYVDAFLLDGGAGQGIACDWDLAARAVASTARPVLLAGGLTPQNVGEAIARVRPFAVDVASGVEVGPGEKDRLKVEAFARAVASADRLLDPQARV